MRQCRWSNDALLPPESVTPVNLEPIVMTPGAFSPVNLSSLHSHDIKDIYAFASRHCPQSGSYWLLAVKEVCLSTAVTVVFLEIRQENYLQDRLKKMPCAFSSPRNTCSLFSPLFSLFSCLALLLAVSLGNFTCKLQIQQVTLVFCTPSASSNFRWASNSILTPLFLLHFYGQSTEGGLWWTQDSAITSNICFQLEMKTDLGEGDGKGKSL